MTFLSGVFTLLPVVTVKLAQTLKACDDALDPTRPELYEFLKTFLKEMGEIFTEDYLFLGGDELPTTCTG
jgi:hypothetical protein